MLFETDVVLERWLAERLHNALPSRGMETGAARVFELLELRSLQAGATTAAIGECCIAVLNAYVLFFVLHMLVIPGLLVIGAWKCVPCMAKLEVLAS